MPVPIRHRNLPLLLLQAREAVISHFRPLLNHFGLTEQQWRVIRVLEEKGNLSPGRSPSAARSSSPASPGCSRAWKRSGWCNGVGWTLTSVGCSSRTRARAASWSGPWPRSSSSSTETWSGPWVRGWSRNCTPCSTGCWLRGTTESCRCASRRGRGGPDQPGPVPVLPQCRDRAESAEDTVPAVA